MAASSREAMDEKRRTASAAWWERQSILHFIEAHDFATRAAQEPKFMSKDHFSRKPSTVREDRTIYGFKQSAAPVREQSDEITITEADMLPSGVTSCELCGTQLVETGAPIWEIYCPNGKCERERRLLFSRLKSSMEHRERKIRDLNNPNPELLKLRARINGVLAMHGFDHLDSDEAIREIRFIMRGRAE